LGVDALDTGVDLEGVAVGRSRWVVSIRVVRWCVEKSAMTRRPQQPPTQVFAQQRRSGCGTLLVALLVLGIITAIVIVLGAFGLLDWIFS
jgi:hypothetical protein